MTVVGCRLSVHVARLSPATPSKRGGTTHVGKSTIPTTELILPSTMQVKESDFKRKVFFSFRRKLNYHKWVFLKTVPQTTTLEIYCGAKTSVIRDEPA